MKDVEKLLGPKGIILFEKRREKCFIRQVDALAASMRGFQKEPGNLKEYSPWLSGYKADTFGNELEIPGQQREQITYMTFFLFPFFPTFLLF